MECLSSNEFATKEELQKTDFVFSNDEFGQIPIETNFIDNNNFNNNNDLNNFTDDNQFFFYKIIIGEKS